jgi:hypothetical protein
MRSFLTYGFISLVGVAALYACGDDSGDGSPATGGSGGSAGAGTGGSAGGSNMAGSGGGGGSAGSTGGTAGAGGAPNVTPPASNCTGCVQLSTPIPATPLDTTNMLSQATYAFSAAPTAAPFDLTNVQTITWRVQALTTNANYYVKPFFQNRPPEDSTYKGDYGEMAVMLTPAAFPAGTWMDIAVNVAALPGGSSGADAGVDGGTADAGDAGAAAPAGTLAAYDKSLTRYVGLYVGALAAAGAGLVSVEVDSVTVVGTSNFTTQDFATNPGNFIIDTGYQSPVGALAPAFK